MFNTQNNRSCPPSISPWLLSLPGLPLSPCRLGPCVRLVSFSSLCLSFCLPVLFPLVPPFALLLGNCLCLCLVFLLVSPSLSHLFLFSLPPSPSLSLSLFLSFSFALSLSLSPRADLYLPWNPAATFIFSLSVTQAFPLLAICLSLIIICPSLNYLPLPRFCPSGSLAPGNQVQAEARQPAGRPARFETALPQEESHLRQRLVHGGDTFPQAGISFDESHGWPHGRFFLHIFQTSKDQRVSAI